MNIEKRSAIWVFGGKGFIGKHLINYFSENYEICSIGRNFIQPEKKHCLMFSNHEEVLTELRRMVIENELDIPEFILYAAGSGSVPLSIVDPFSDYGSNVSDYYRFLSMFGAVFNSETKIVYLSSAAVYGAVTKPSHTKNNINLDLIASPYGFNKFIAEEVGKFYASKFDFKVANLRLFSVYGEGLEKQIGWDLYKRFSAGERTISLKGTGLEKRDWIYVLDAVTFIDQMLYSNEIWTGSCSTLNCGTGKASTVKDYAEIFCNYFHLESPSFTSEISNGDPGVLVADMDIETRLVDWAPNYSLKKGLFKYFEWLSCGR